MSEPPKTYRTSKRYPTEALRDELTRKLGLQRDDHERRHLRTRLYSVRVPAPEGATADELARMLLSVPATDDQERAKTGISPASPEMAESPAAPQPAANQDTLK